MGPKAINEEEEDEEVIRYVRNLKFDRRITGGIFRNKRVTLYA